jgi:hypothetical protein
MINNYLDNLEGLIIRINPIRKGVHHNLKTLIYLNTQTKGKNKRKCKILKQYMVKVLMDTLASDRVPIWAF